MTIEDWCITKNYKIEEWANSQLKQADEAISILKECSLTSDNFLDREYHQGIKDTIVGLQKILEEINDLEQQYLRDKMLRGL